METNKRLFLGLFLLFTFLILLALTYLLFYINRPDALIFQYTFYIFTGFIALLAGISLLALTVMMISLLKGRPVKSFNRLVGKTVFFFFPLIMQLGRLLHITTESIQRSFIEINNRLVEVKRLKVSSEKLLLLLPHCLQEENCPHKITRDPLNCRRCGKCPMTQLLLLAEKWQVKIQVVTGGTLARQAVQKYRPECILAVACERDLASGIVDSFPIPVCGVLNERPSGPCFNTQVCMETLNKKVAALLGQRK